MTIDFLLLQTEPVKEKLRNLQKYLPGQSPLVYEFGKYLADYLHPELYPEGFSLMCRTALQYIKQGKDFRDRPISKALVGHDPKIYERLENTIPQIIDAVCPPEFARAVKG